MNKRLLSCAFTALAVCIAVPRGLSAQTLATGDSRVVNQPVLPAVCQTLNAQFTSAQRSSPPSSDDTSRIQAALNSCASSGKSVVLAASGSNNAFYSSLLTVNGEGLVINSGVTLFGNNSYASQKELILITGTNSSLIGPGTVDGRGDIVSGSARLVQASNITNLIVFNVTLTQARHPNLYVEGGNGFTAWGVTIRTPADRKNADGIDIDSMTNATVINSSVNAGDDGIAVKTNSGPASNMTIKNSRFYGTHGISIGSQTFNGVTNILFTGNYIYGVDLNGITASDANAIRVKSDVDCGGRVDRVTYLNTCIIQAKHLIVLDTMYGSCDGTDGTPMFTNIVINGVLATNSVSSAYTRIRGLDSSHLIDAYLAHVSLDKTTQSSDQDASVALSASNITPSGTGIQTRSFTLSGSVPTCAF